MVEFVGLDIETTGSNPDSNLIQIGAAVIVPGRDESQKFDVEVFVADVCVHPKDLNMQAEAMKVNGFTYGRLLAGDHIWDVDARLTTWLSTRVKGRAFPVGWNVGTFDMTYVRPALPHAMKFFQSYRSVDLNSAVLTLAGEKWETTKKAAKRYAEAFLATKWDVETGPTWHDAGYDAAASIIAFRYLTEGRP